MEDESRVTLVAPCGREFPLSVAVAEEAETLRLLLSDADGTRVPVPNVTSDVLARVVEYCQFLAAERTAPSPPDVLDSFHHRFFDVDTPTLCATVLAANYLNVAALMDAACQKVADMIKGRSPAQIRELFGLEAMAPEEEERARRENEWAFM